MFTKQNDCRFIFQSLVEVNCFVPNSRQTNNLLSLAQKTKGNNPFGSPPSAFNFCLFIFAFLLVTCFSLSLIFSQRNIYRRQFAIVHVNGKGLLGITDFPQANPVGSCRHDAHVKTTLLACFLYQ